MIGTEGVFEVTFSTECSCAAGGSVSKELTLPLAVAAGAVSTVACAAFGAAAARP
jgi:hypothetical protein